MKTVAERFWPRIDKTSTCWLWTGAKQSAGYGHLYVEGRTHLAHRLAYETLVGPVPDGLVLDHLCRVHHCVNPAHLEPVTLAENFRRGVGLERAAAAKLAKTHCKHGHEYTPENTRLNWKGARVCRECARIACRKHDAKRRPRTKQAA